MPRRDRIAEFQEVIVRQPTAEECQALLQPSRLGLLRRPVARAREGPVVTSSRERGEFRHAVLQVLLGYDGVLELFTAVEYAS